jgi:hypothetical protein
VWGLGGGGVEGCEEGNCCCGQEETGKGSPSHSRAGPARENSEEDVVDDETDDELYRKSRI